MVKNIKQGSFGFIPAASSLVAPASAVPCPFLDMALSPGGALLLLAGEGGRLQLHSASDGRLQRSLEGHRGDVYAARFFPSGEVALSVGDAGGWGRRPRDVSRTPIEAAALDGWATSGALRKRNADARQTSATTRPPPTSQQPLSLPFYQGGADHTVRIWSLDDGSCAVTLSGHTAGVTCIDILERGRNILCKSGVPRADADAVSGVPRADASAHLFRRSALCSWLARWLCQALGLRNAGHAQDRWGRHARL